MATFSVNDQTRRVNGTGNGTNKDFSFSFQVNATSNVKVYIDGTLKSESSDYNIINSSAAAGLNTDGTGVVRFGTAPANNAVVTVLSDVPVARTSVYTSGGNITSAALENDLDTITMQIGDLEEKLSRAVIASVDEPVTSTFELPNKTTRINKNLAFDSNGNPTVSDSAVSSASVSGVTTGAAGSSASATATYSSATGDIAFNFTIPQGSAGAAGNDGVFGAIATQAEAQAGTENTKGMTSLRTKEAIAAQVSGIAAVSSKFFGVKITTDSVGRKIVTQEHTLVGGSEALTISDYDTYFFATGSVGLIMNASGHLLINLP